VPENFARLKAGLVDRVTTHTDSVHGFLERHDQPVTRFVLLDHMDWLSDRFFPLLEAEWQAIVDKAAPGARLIWRSGGFNTDFLDDVRVTIAGRSRGTREILAYDRDLAARLHPLDRVHTYGSFHIAELMA
jgi:S-adenosylmethionine-diacylglycerol 3-amino-3-carboxypropyl transferase